MTHWTRGGAATACLTVLLSSLMACSGDDATESDSPEPEKVETVPPPLATTASIDRVVGQLPRPKRRALVDQFGEVVNGWMDQAHVGGDFPRTVDDTAWAGFTVAAAKTARRNRALTSVAESSEQVDTVQVIKRVVRYDVVADQGRAVGATARVVLTYKTTGEVAETVRVRGRLLLTPSKSGWKIFGYDLTEGKR